MALKRMTAGSIALLLVSGTLALLVPASASADSAPLDPANPATPVTVTADALPTVQLNPTGIGWSQVVVGDKVYVAGKFSSARPAGAPAGTNETPRNNLLAYDINTGELDTSFRPDLNAQALVVAASPDGSRIYVGGDFASANGQPRNRIAAYSTATGELISSFRPSVTGQVRAIAATDSTVYIGGAVSAVGSVGRTRLAAVSAADGSLLPWAPQTGVGPTNGNDDGNRNTSDHVMSMVTTMGGSQIVVAGRFDTLNGQKATGIGALDAVTGATRPFAVSQMITNQGINSAIYSLSTDGEFVYGTGYDFYGPGNVEGSFQVTADGGVLQWMNDCHGDTYSSFPMNGALYIAGHPHVCSNIGGYPEHSPRIHRYATATSLVATNHVGRETVGNSNFTGQPAPSLLNWFPTMAVGSVSGAYQAGWSVSGNDRYVVYAGEFPRVNGKAQQGLVRYALPDIAPNKVAPSATGFEATAVAVAPGTVRVSWPAASDQDNENLTYRVYRDGATGTAVHTVTRASTFWQRPSLAFHDTTADPGTHTYRVSATDPAGNRINTPWVTVETPAGPPAPNRAYAEAVRADGAESLWPLSDSSGVARDSIGGNDLTVGSGVTRGRGGAITGDSNTSFEFTGRSSSTTGTSRDGIWAPHTFSVEAWFQTTSTQGGKIIGFGNRTDGSSTNYDRHVYMDRQGRVIFGVYPGTERTVTGADRYNDGRWHHVVASLGADGMALYVDGVLVGSRDDTHHGQNYLGQWRVGGDSTWGSNSAWFDGRIDEAAVYPLALSADRVQSHYTLGTTGAPSNLLPTAAFTAGADFLVASFDGSGSSDPDGSVASWAWDFGDGTTGTGAGVVHSYAQPGTYTVTLTVTDDDGATAQRSETLTVTAAPPNQAPEATFTAAVSGLAASFDGSGSVDADGSITSYAWDFGDGRTGAGATTSHTYAEDGTFTVRLTVTDDDGATATAEETITTVTPSVLASDSFQRTVSGGLGSADVGGPWTVTYGSTRQSVAGGTATLALQAPGNNTGSFLRDVSQSSVDLRTTFSLSAAPSGAGTYVYLRGRIVDTNQEYRARLRMLADGQVALAFTKQEGTASDVLIGGEIMVPDLTYMPGTPLNVRIQVSGTGTTELVASVWAEGSQEPAVPTLTRTDSTASLQAPGGIGISAYLSGSATTPTSVRLTRFTAAHVAH